MCQHVLAPWESQQPRRVELGDDTALRQELGIDVESLLAEPRLATDHQVDLGLARKPSRELGWVGDRLPDTLWSMAEVPLEAQHITVLLAEQPSVHGQSFLSRWASSASSRAAHKRRKGSIQASSSASGPGRS